MSDATPALKTPLFDLHQENGGKIVPFAGYAMPVNYAAGIIKEHQHTREQAGLFDVSHMGQILVKGENIAELLETVMPIDIVGMKPGKQKYGLFLNDTGGVLDDLMVINRLGHADGDHFILVVNAACKNQDFDYLLSKLGNKLAFTMMDQQALIALQGPKAAEALVEIAESSTSHPNHTLREEMQTFKFMDVRDIEICGCQCIVSRSGYSGEDGFEISVPSEQVVYLTEQLQSHESIALTGLGARDSLRMEAGLCLYGQDMDTDITPIEAGLKWAISPARRSQGSRAGGFPGSDIVLQQIDNGATKKLVGLQPEGRAPMRHGTQLTNANGDTIGVITSGGFSPTLGKPISMGYVNIEHISAGTSLFASIRGKSLPLTVASLPFVPHQYFR